MVICVKRTLSLLLALLLVCPFIALPQKAEAADAVPASICGRQEWNALGLLNAYRIENGSLPLTVTAALQTAAEIRAEELSERFDHERPNFKGFETVCDEETVNLSYKYCEENILSGYETPREAIEAWKAVPAYDANMLSSSAAHVGIGLCDYGDGTCFWEQLFIDDDCSAADMEVVAPEGGWKTCTGTTLSDLGAYVKITCGAHGESYMPLIDGMCAGYDSSRVGTQTVTVSYGALSRNITVTVSAKEDGEYTSGKFTYTVSGGAATITAWSGNNEELNIPSVLDGCKVKAIGSGAFILKTLTALTIPDGVESIGESAFEQAKFAGRVYIPASVSNIEYSSFSTMEGVTGFSVASDNPGYTSQDGVLYNKSKTTLMAYPLGAGNTVFLIPATVTKLATYAFTGCTDLQAVYVPSPAISASLYTFNGCTLTVYGKSGTSLNTQITNRSILGNLTFSSMDSYGDTWVVFEPNGGTVTTTVKNLRSGERYGVLPTPTRAGYVFDGWYTAKTGGVKVTANTTVSSDDHMLYARWSLKQYSVKLDPNGGTVISSAIMVTHGGKYGTIPTPSRTGYVFLGWYTAADGGELITSESAVTIERDHTLYARWEPKIINISFDANGGTVTTGGKAVSYGDEYGELETPIRSGYCFDGWYTARTGGALVTAEDFVTSDVNIMLYAHWTANEYTVRFDPNGGSDVADVLTVTFGEKYGTLPTPTREGYMFAGWYTAKTGGDLITANTVVKMAADQTLIANWVAKSYVVFFNANGGEVGKTSVTVTFGKAYGELPTPTHEYYQFAGWYTEAEDGDKVLEDTIVNTASDDILYAHWAEEVYIVTLDPGEGTLISNTMSVASGKPFGTLPVPTYVGHTFGGWYTAETGGERITEDTVATQANRTLYAHWALADYTVTLDNNDGSDPSAAVVIPVTFNSPYGTLPTLTRTGYEFAGWYTNREGGLEITAETTVEIAVDHTLYAHWTPLEFTVTLNANGGTLEEKTIRVLYGSAYGALPTPVYKGFKFTGWYTEVNNGSLITKDSIFTGIEDQTLYALWTRADSEVVVGLHNFVQRVTYTDNQFPDISDTPDGPWYSAYKQGVVKKAVELGMVVGNADGEYKPKDGLKLSEAIKLASVVHDIYNGGTGEFDQSVGERWYDVYVIYAIANGIIKYDDFAVYTEYATRAEMAYIFANALPDEALAVINGTVLLKDITQDTDHADSIIELYKAGVVQGDTDFNFRPYDNINRAEAAAIITRMAIEGERVLN